MRSQFASCVSSTLLLHVVGLFCALLLPTHPISDMVMLVQLWLAAGVQLAWVACRARGESADHKARLVCPFPSRLMTDFLFSLALFRCIASAFARPVRLRKRASLLLVLSSPC